MIERANAGEARAAEAEAWERQRRLAGLFAQVAGDLGRRYSPELATLARFNATTPPQADVKKRMEAIVAELPAMVDSGRGIVWYGAVGTGKDHLMAALLYHATKLEITCRRINGQDFFGMMRDRMTGDLQEEDVFRKYSEPKILAISDPVPPASELSAFRLETLCRLINRRYEAMRPTWITMNAHSEEEAENYLGSRIWDRLRDSAELVPCLWPSYRESSQRQDAGVAQTA